MLDHLHPAGPFVPECCPPKRLQYTTFLNVISALFSATFQPRISVRQTPRSARTPLVAGIAPKKDVDMTVKKTGEYLGAIPLRNAPVRSLPVKTTGWSPFFALFMIMMMNRRGRHPT